MRRITSAVIIVALLWAARPVLAHHSYADYDRTERYALRGIITDIHWANPHILFTVNDGASDTRIEWITLTGAEKTSVAQDQFTVGDEVVVIGSRNRNPAVNIMTVIKELHLPAKNWQWVVPTP